MFGFWLRNMFKMNSLASLASFWGPGKKNKGKKINKTLTQSDINSMLKNIFANSQHTRIFGKVVS